MKKMIVFFVTALLFAFCTGVGAAEATAGSMDVGDLHGGNDTNDTASTVRMLWTPGFGDDIYLRQPAGMWMFDYKFSQTNQGGLRTGTTNVPVDNVIPNSYMMAPTSMTMNMQMLMAMYGASDRLTLMATATYITNNMSMAMNMGMGDQPVGMSTQGFGDTELKGLYGINKNLTASLGVSLPTGSINQTVNMMGQVRAPYDMQLGSGTVDFKPSLTYNRFSADNKWNWGGQTTYTARSGVNENGYTLGNDLNVTGWVQHMQSHYTTWLRLSYNDTGSISGYDPQIEQLFTSMMTSDADPANYGGRELDGLIGVSYHRGNYSIGVEFGIPLYQNLNGLQLKNKSFFTAGGQIMF